MSEADQGTTPATEEQTERTVTRERVTETEERSNVTPADGDEDGDETDAG